eukprot:TRINITY_DN10787_c0_g1_i1.p1 TRINITY_DN10787_c0_g1~~TRINITY_DN10787_c0_g1_i1.p1  ORF type:complete len:281 (-),score=44.63 TRINITY_DN10787_c0_g1_i1:52-894(-)
MTSTRRSLKTAVHRKNASSRDTEFVRDFSQFRYKGANRKEDIHSSAKKRKRLCEETEKLDKVDETQSSTDKLFVSATSETEYRLLDRTFYQCDALELAPKLLGKLLRRDDVVLQITEVEAYRQNDTACHGRFGVTARTAPMFGPGGHAYVYLCYGFHSMLNVVADKEGVGAAVLIRSCAPIAGLKTIQNRRGQTTDKPILLTGPGKQVGQALGLTTEWSSHPLYSPGGLEMLDGPVPEKMLVGPRVGINYAAPQDVKALWRFAIAGSAWISTPQKTLKPA